ncbi:hypothetical protein ACFSKY_06370 [Azotobacter chroococcum]|uniref:Uncharacterized protein n=1 Tax=Azotobacter chroococcum TaxID=353 RepID=A0A4R1PP31_9GAMM|nr:hypothetical protein [Azotobacter chroococcum]TBV91331.1 hypothetical protein E0E53_21590 [Azotobacter chroococcum]TCL32513.1 hypothetical protein EV691_10739 [Azotobacter chroococcum]
MKQYNDPAERVSVEYNGKTYTATYRVEHGCITVSTLRGEKSTQLGGLTAKALAIELLIELITESKA